MHHINIPYHTIPHNTHHINIPYHTIPYHTTLYHIIPYHTIPYNMHHINIPYHTIPYHTIPHYTIQHAPYQYITYSTTSYHVVRYLYTIPYHTITVNHTDLMVLEQLFHFAMLLQFSHADRPVTMAIFDRHSFLSPRAAQQSFCEFLQIIICGKM